MFETLQSGCFFHMLVLLNVRFSSLFHPFIAPCPVNDWWLMETGRRLCKQATQLLSDWTCMWGNLTRLAVTSELLRKSVLMSESHRRTPYLPLGLFLLPPTSAPAFVFSFHLSSIKCNTDPFSQQTMSPPALARIVSLSLCR